MNTDNRQRLLSNRVRERRKALGWTQDELGEKVGISRQAINQIENVEGYEPLTPIALRLAAVLDVEVTWLFYEGAPEPAEAASR